MILYTDGYKNNSETGYLVCNSIGDVLSKEKIAKNKTNNEAEYFGMIKGLELVDNKGIVYTDSKLVEGQVIKGWRVKARHLSTLVDTCKGIVKRKKAQVIWIPREKNLAGKIIESEQPKSKVDIFRFELGLDICDILKDISEEKRNEILSFIDTYQPRR